MQRQWLVDIRNSKSMTQESVAELSDIKRAYYTQIETGYRSPSVAIAKRIADTLGFDWTLFFEEKCSVSEQNHTA